LPERLQKILSRAGVASRREAEKMILDGRIVINGTVVSELGTKADPSKDVIRLDGKRLKQSDPARVTILLNKPRGVMSTRNDPEGRRTVVDLVKGLNARVYPIGRLDYNAEGLILLTNDGDLAFGLLRPGSAERVYVVRVKGDPRQEDLDRIRQGMILDRRRTLPARVRRLSGGKNSWVEVGMHEGRKNQVIRMFQAIGHPVIRLRRVRIGSLELGSLKPGEFRTVSPMELARLRASARPSSSPRSSSSPRPSNSRRPRSKERPAARPARRSRS
jgi:23S rRNA pseudouridine2605 synthase